MLKSISHNRHCVSGWFWVWWWWWHNAVDELVVVLWFNLNNLHGKSDDRLLVRKNVYLLVLKMGWWKMLIFLIYLIHLQSLLSASSSIAFHSILSQFILKSDFCILGSCYCNNLLLKGDLDISEEEKIVAIHTSSIPLHYQIISYSVLCGHCIDCYCYWLIMWHSFVTERQW